MILMNTGVIIWDVLKPSKIPNKSLSSIETADKENILIISDISIWEISMLIKKKRLEVDSTATSFINLFLQSRNINIQSITP